MTIIRYDIISKKDFCITLVIHSDFNRRGADDGSGVRCMSPLVAPKLTCVVVERRFSDLL